MAKPRAFGPGPIAEAVAGDLPGLLALEHDSFAADRLSVRQYRYHLRSPRARVLVARDRTGAIAGCAVVFLRPRWRDARLYSIAVAAHARGRGLGRRLLAAAEAAARAAGAGRLRLEVRVDNAAALALYAGAGYVRVGRRARYYADGADAEVCERRLT